MNPGYQVIHPHFPKGTELTSLNSTILYTNSPNLLVAGQDKAITQSCGGHVFGPSLCDPRGTWRKAHPQLGFFQVAEKTRKKVVNQGKPKSSLNISKPSPFLVVVYDQKGPLPVYPTDDHGLRTSTICLVVEPPTPTWKMMDLKSVGKMNIPNMMGKI